MEGQRKACEQTTLRQNRGRSEIQKPSATAEIIDNKSEHQGPGTFRRRYIRKRRQTWKSRRVCTLPSEIQTERATKCAVQLQLQARAFEMTKLSWQRKSWKRARTGTKEFELAEPLAKRRGGKWG